MALPPGVNERDFAAAMREFERAVGAEWVFTKDEDVSLYRDAYSPVRGEDLEKLVSAAVAPESTEQVQAVVRTANRHRIPIYPISTGKNLGYGGSAPNLSGSVVLDLKRMNRSSRSMSQRHSRSWNPVCPTSISIGTSSSVSSRSGSMSRIPAGAVVLGNSLDHGVGYTYGALSRSLRFALWHGGRAAERRADAHTGMGALPGAATWAEYRYGFGPHVDGLFSQGNFGVVTKMGFWLMPEPEAYLSGAVTVPGRNESSSSSISSTSSSTWASSECRTTARRCKRSSASRRSRRFSSAHLHRQRATSSGGRGTTARVTTPASCNSTARRRTVRANWDYAQRLLREIPGATLKLNRELEFPLTADKAEGLHKVALGIPNLEIFNIGRRQSAEVPGWDGEVWFSPVIPIRTVRPCSRRSRFSRKPSVIGMPLFTHPASVPATWMYRAFIFIMGLPVSRTDVLANQRMREAFMRLANVGAAHGWGEYRTPPIFQDLIISQYSFNDHASRRFSETLKDAVDPNGIISAGRGGIWPRHLRDARERRG